MTVYLSNRKPEALRVDLRAEARERYGADVEIVETDAMDVAWVLNSPNVQDHWRAIGRADLVRPLNPEP